MLRTKDIAIIVCLLIVSFFATGCSESALHPASDVVITSNSQFNIQPTGLGLSNLPSADIGMTLLNSIPCNLISYDAEYFTNLGQRIDSLNTYGIEIQARLYEPDTEVTTTIYPYPLQLENLMQTSTSDISPVRCNIILHFKDVNDNEFTEKASFLLFKYNSEETETNDDSE